MPDHNASIKYRVDKLIKRYVENNVNICSNCYYELKINVYDDCNNKIDATVSPIKIGSTVSDCNNDGFTESSFVLDLKKAGEYTITFELSMNPDVITAYTDDFIKRNTNLRQEFSFIIAQLRNTNFSGCFSDCHNCEVALGTKAQFQLNVKQRLTDNSVDVTKYATDINTWSSGLYDVLLANCITLQGTCVTDPCDGLRQTMKQDVSPGGQYALFDSYGNPLEQDINVLYWHFRDKFPTRSLGDPLYEQTKIQKLDGVVMSPCDALFTLKDLVENWRDEWADLFLEYHPEYCALTACMNIAALKRWDDKIKALCVKASDIPKYTGGLTYNPANAIWLLQADPFMSNPYTQSYVSSFGNDLLNYSTARSPYNNAQLTKKSLPQYVDYLLYCADSTGNTNATTNVSFISRWNNCVPQAQCRVPDREWATYATYYFELKERYYQILRDASCGTACKIGRPEASLGSSCPTVSDFVVSADTSPCGTGLQSIRVLYEGNPVAAAVKIVIAYPRVNSSQPLPDVLTFLPGEKLKNLCISNLIPVDLVKVDTIYCGSQKSVFYPPALPGTPVNCNNSFTIKIDTSSYYATRFARTNASVTNTIGNGRWILTVIANQPISEGIIYSVNLVVNGVIETLQIQGPNIITSKTYGWNPASGYPSVSFYSYSCIDIYNGCSPLYRNKISRLDRIDYNQSFPTNVDSLKNDGLAQVQRMVAENCANSADAWIRQLDSCFSTNATYKAKLATLRQKLIDVCKLGGDVNHLGGASAATPVATADGYTSFKDAMIGVLGAGSLNMICNPWILSAPYPYNVEAQITDLTVGSSSAAICSRLSVLQTEYNSLGAGKTFFQYLSGKYGPAMKLKQEELDQLVKSCSNCRYLIAAPIKLPVFLDPDPKSKGCITATEFNSGMTALSQEPWAGGLNITHENYENIVSTYLNFRWGFSLGYAAYISYKQKIVTDPTALLCNSPAYTTVTPDPFGCMLEMIDGAVASGRRRYNEYIDSVRQDFKRQYVNVCAGTQTSVNLKTLQQLYHFTLYYYDQAGNLVRTVPPEGVDVLDATRLNSTTSTIPADFTCNYNGPLLNTNVPAALDELTTTFNNTTGTALELWIKGRPSGASQVITPTSNNKYFFTTCLSSTYYYVSIYKMDPQDGAITILSSNDIAVPISNFSQGSWTHLVLQGRDLASGALSLYVNGELMANDSKAPSAPCAWEISVGATAVTITSDLSDLKHLRTYNRQLTADEIWANSQEPCMGIAFPQTPLRLWARFNIPANGAPGTIPNSNIEVRPMPVAPQHRLTTDYAYTSLNQVVVQKTPDAGKSSFWYDYLGRLVASQNAKQVKGVNLYSYTTFDALGRTIEAGEVKSSRSLPAAGFLNNSALLNTNSGVTDYISTSYDFQSMPSFAGIQENIRNRVSRITHVNNTDPGSADEIDYSYDLLGNVKTVWHNGGRSAYARTEYKYDLISGNVNTILFHPGLDDQFYYGYEYDAENRIIKALSGINGSTADLSGILNPVTDAYYHYYKHGPLARTELGRNNIQGIDYAYTLQGWLKGMNSNYLTPDIEMGKDGKVGQTSTIAKDVIGFTLDYFQGDYTPISATTVANPFGLKWTGQTGDLAGQNLYNGNISHSVLSLKGINNGVPVGYSYRYDQLNRLRTMRQHTLAAVATTWGMTQAVAAYAEDLTYDANGNILTYKRNGPGTVIMDRLSYLYPRNAAEQLNGNRLRYIKDSVATQVYPTVDIYEQHPGTYVRSDTSNASGDNYQYDEIGNLVKDIQGGIANIEWNIFGKIAKISKTDNTKIAYIYDAAGNRSMKIFTDAGNIATTTFYEHDATGNLLATYERRGDANITWKEQYLYGSSRLGVWKPNMLLAGTSTKDALWTAVNNRNYEIVNHLGNVLTTVTDNKVFTGGVYEATITSAVDYSPFGMQMVGRKLNGGGYRAGFNGKENDNEVKGEGNQIDYGMRIYDPRIGKFLSVDPLTKSYSMLTPYQFASNSPVAGIDRDGLEFEWFQKTWNKFKNSTVIWSSGGNAAGGLGYGANGGLRVGTARDVIGTTQFTLTTAITPFNQDLRDGSENPAMIVGGEVGADAGFQVITKSTFAEAMNSLSMSSASFTGKVEVGLGVGVTVGEDNFGLSGILGAGITFKSGNQTVVNSSISITTKEKEGKTSESGDWFVDNIVPMNGENGDVVGYMGELMESVPKRGSEKSGTIKNTGIRVMSDAIKVKQNGIEKSAAQRNWKSYDYKVEEEKIND